MFSKYSNLNVVNFVAFEVKKERKMQPEITKLRKISYTHKELLKRKHS